MSKKENKEYLILVLRIRIDSSDTGSSILGWIPIPIRIQSLSRGFIIKNLKKLQLEQKFNIFLIENGNSPIPRPP